jgi:hypothetical protein
LRYSVEPRGGYLFASLRGHDNAEEMRAFLVAVHRECRRRDCPRILVSVRASRAVFKPEEYGLPGYANELAGPQCRIALVGDTPELQAAHEYIELVARQQKLDVRAFRDEVVAARWLASTPGPSRRYRLGRVVLEGAPEGAGVYALWEGEELVYYGRASSIRESLQRHYEERFPATHFSWETCADPAAREAELLRDYERMFGRRPRRNSAG